MSEAIHDILINRANVFPTLLKLIKDNGVVHITPKPSSDFFPFLVKTIAGQQLSNKAATTIWKRVQTKSDISSSSLYDFCVPENHDEIKACGLSRNKVKAILELRNAIENKTIDFQLLKLNDITYIIDEITKLWGFGTWSAEMVALFFFGFPNVWSDGDVALKRGLKIICDIDKTSKEYILESFEQYQSYLSLHIWQGLDSNLIS